MRKSFPFEYQASGNEGPSVEMGRGVKAKMYSLIVAIPGNFSELVGFIVSQWSYEEWLLRRTIYLLATGGDPRRGRIAVAMPRPADALIRIAQLMSLDNIESKVNIKELHKLLQRIQKRRDLVAHGVWMEDANGAVFIQRTNNQWQAAGERAAIARVIRPEAVSITEGFLSKIVEDIQDAIMETSSLHHQIEAQFLRPSP